MTDFTLHPQLAKDTVEIGDFPLCLALLAKDANYPWVILVPRVADIREIHELSATDRTQLIEEISATSATMELLLGAEKMNVGALGNMVPQLHIHVIARFSTDPAWPGPIWGKVDAVSYGEDLLAKRVRDLRDALPKLKRKT